MKVFEINHLSSLIEIEF